MLPVLLSLGFGAVEFAHFFYVRHTLQAAARDGARVASLPGTTNSDVTTAVGRAMNFSGLSGSGYTTKIANADTAANLTLSSTSSGTPVRVTVSCTWSNVGIRLIGIIGGSKQVVGETTTRRE